MDCKGVVMVVNFKGVGINIWCNILGYSLKRFLKGCIIYVLCKVVW